MPRSLFRRPPPRVLLAAVHRRFERVLRAMLLTGLASYSSYIGLFWYFGISGMPLVNTGMLVISGLCLWLLSRRRVNLALAAGSLMVLVHAACATMLLGWDGEFHLYAYLVLCLLLLSPTLGNVTKFMAFCAVTTAYVFAWRHFSPLSVASPVLVLFSTMNVVLFSSLLAVLSAIFSSATTQTADEYETRNAELARQANTDSLTGLHNRRYLRDILHQELVRYQRSGRAFALIVGDVDNFKSINDRHGHQGGDAVLVAVSAVIRDAVRAPDLVARWGGEEFLVFLPETTLDDALGVAERIQQLLAQSPVLHRAQPVHARMTLGVAMIRPGQTIDALLQQADEALYRGKRAGRNRIEVSTDAAAA